MRRARPRSRRGYRPLTSGPLPLLAIAGDYAAPTEFATWPRAAMLSAAWRHTFKPHFASTSNQGSYLVLFSWDPTPYQCITLIWQNPGYTLALWDSGATVESATLEWSAEQELTFSYRYGTSGAAYVEVSGATSGNGIVTGDYDPAVIPADPVPLIVGGSDYFLPTVVDATFGDIFAV